MIDAIIAVFAIIILASAAIVGAVMVALIVFGLRCIFGPCFDEYGEIHECPGCQGAKENACPGILGSCEIYRAESPETAKAQEGGAKE